MASADGLGIGLYQSFALAQEFGYSLALADNRRRSLSGLWIRARTSTLRVFSSTLDLMAVISPSNILSAAASVFAASFLADFKLPQLLLWHKEIEIDRVKLLQCDDRRACVQILPDIDLANA